LADLVKPPVTTAAVTAPKKTWVDEFMAKARGAGAVVADATPTSAKSVIRSAGSVAAEVGQGAILGGLIGAARATFGYDASPAVMGVGMVAGVLLAESHPQVAEVAARGSGQAAAIMFDRKAEKLLGGGSSGGPAPAGLKPIGGAARGGLNANGEDPIVAKAKALWGKKKVT
jgi:hypothetical protein